MKITALKSFVRAFRNTLFDTMGKRKASDIAGNPNQDLSDFLMGTLLLHKCS